MAKQLRPSAFKPRSKTLQRITRAIAKNHKSIKSLRISNMTSPLQMRFKKHFLAATALFLSIAPQSLAQNNNDAALTKQFRQAFESGCNQGQTPGVKNQKKYCTCLANSYQARYSGVELSAISQLAGQTGQQGSTLVNIMMSPEARSCASKN